jgi:hypothetical protein
LEVGVGSGLEVGVEGRGRGKRVWGGGAEDGGVMPKAVGRSERPTDDESEGERRDGTTNELGWEGNRSRVFHRGRVLGRFKGLRPRCARSREARDP